MSKYSARNACSLVLTAADCALVVPIGVSDKYDEAMVGERSTAASRPRHDEFQLQPKAPIEPSGKAAT